MSNSTEPSLIGAHVKFVAGAVSELIGTEGATENKQTAIEEMRAAKSDTTATKNSLLGTVESKLGSAVGCEGMKEEGIERKVDLIGKDVVQSDDR